MQYADDTIYRQCKIRDFYTCIDKIEWDAGPLVSW